MPGTVSDSCDPEFGTGANAADVALAVCFVLNQVGVAIGDTELRNIVELVHSKDPGKLKFLRMRERDLRVLRFALNRALESL